MPYLSKLGNLSVFLAKAETTYGTPIALAAAADAQLLALSDRHEGLVKRDALYKGDSGPAPGNMGMLPRFKQAGFFDAMAMPFRFKGKGAAYSAVIKPAGFVLFQAAGFDLAFSGGAGAEKWTATPTPDATIPTSLTTEYYHFGEKYAGAGALGSMDWEFGNGAPPLFTFNLSWIANGKVVDAAAPTTAVYPDLTVIEPIAYGATINIGSFLTGVVRSGSFKSGRKLVARPNLNGSSDHMGFVSTSWEPEVTLVCEKTALVASPFHTAAGLDARRLMEDAGQFAITVGWNQAVQYNRLKQVMSQVQLIDVQDTQEDGVPTWTIRGQPIASTPGTVYDWMSLVYD